MTSISRVLRTVLLAGILAGCKKEFDTPPVKPAEALDKINVAGIKAKYKAGAHYQFRGDSSLYCIVTADEASGNLYKEIYVKDATGALHIKLVSSGGLFIGDSIRINLNGAVLSDNNRMIQLDSVDLETRIVKLASGYDPQPAVLSMAQILANTTATNATQSRLVKIENVEFVSADQGQTFADAVNHASLTRIVRSCSGQTISVRTSGYCSFAAKLTSTRNGAITGIISQYQNNMELILRSMNDVDMNHALCTVITPTSGGKVYLEKNFNDNNLGSGGWTSYTVTNSAVNWSVAGYSDTPTPFARISGYSGGSNTVSECWLISPAVDLHTAAAPELSFQTASKYNGPPLDVLVALNYSTGAPSTATWTSLSSSFSLSPGNYAWTASGAVSLSAYKSASLRIAFKYSSMASSAATYELDDILVREH